MERRFSATPIWALGVLSLLLSHAIAAMTVPVGGQVVIRSKGLTLQARQTGVPDHSEARSSLKGRVPSATQVGILELHPNNWLEIERHNGDTGFIKKKEVIAVIGTNQRTIYSACSYQNKTPNLIACGYHGTDERSAGEAFYRSRAEIILRSILRHPASALIPASVAFLALVWGPMKHKLTASRRRRVEMFLSLILIIEVLALVSLAGLRIARPVTWDFPHFYMVGRAAVQGLNYADPDVLNTVYESVRMDPAAPPVKRSVILFKYFPMSALVLVYLGMFPYRSALVVHYITQIAYLLGATVLLRRIGSFERSYSGYLTAALLVGTFLPVYGAVSVAQIGFGALFWLALSMCLLDTRPFLSGVALGVGFLYKHLLVIPLALSAFVRRYSTIAGFVVFVVLMAIVIVALFGVLPFQTYVEKGPVSYNNQSISDDINISLIATILRLSDQELPSQGLDSILSNPPFIAGSLFLTAFTILVCVRSRQYVELSLLSASLPVLLALMIFPHVLYNTLPVALVALFAIYSAGNQFLSFRARVLVLSSIAAQYGIVFLRPYPFSFLMPATTWITAVVVLILASRDLESYSSHAPS